MSPSADPITLKYLALPHGLGGRGGVVRFFLLANNIPYEDKLIEMSDWAAEKERLISSKENPCGSVPVVYTKENGKDAQLIEHIATARYLAKIHKATVETTDYNEYVQDLVADEYQGFRDAWAQVAFSGTDDEKATYKSEGVATFLTKFEALYAKYKTHAVYLSVAENSPLWGDAAMYGLLRDHVLTGLVSTEALEKYPNLWAMYQAFDSIPAVKEWCDSKKESTCKLACLSKYRYCGGKKVKVNKEKYIYEIHLAGSDGKFPNETMEQNDN